MEQAHRDDAGAGVRAPDAATACGTMAPVAIEGQALHTDPEPAADVESDDLLLGESRWPPVIAVVVFGAITIAARLSLPHESFTRLPWLVPTLEVVLFVVLVTSDPSGIEERRRMRRVAIVLVGLLVAAALWSTVLLISDLIRGWAWPTMPATCSRRVPSCGWATTSRSRSCTG